MNALFTPRGHPIQYTADTGTNHTAVHTCTETSLVVIRLRARACTLEVMLQEAIAAILPCQKAVEAGPALPALSLAT